MVSIGKYNTLYIKRKVEFGYYLDGGELGDILLPGRYAPGESKIGDEIQVFIHFDSEDRIIATTDKPYAIVGEFAYLKVVSVSPVGAFLDWGLPKDLLVPFREQKLTMEEGKFYPVFIYIDGESNRIAASAKLAQFLNHEPLNYVPGDEVELFIYSITELGYKAAINNRHEGILYKNEVFMHIRKGQKIKGYIRKIREDGKIDLSLQKEGFSNLGYYTDILLKALQENGGSLPLSDKSPADEIYDMLGMSKKLFKKAAGSLYKSRIISIQDDSLQLL